MTERPDQPDEHSEDAPRPEDASTIKDSREMVTGGQKDPMIGLTVGQYTIKRVIGSGGMGTVYEAMQQSPRRTVALKMLKQGIASRSALKRFEYEAQTLGRLRHEHIAQIYEAGTHDDGTGPRPFFAMEYLVGAKSLTQYARDKKLRTHDRLELFSKVCDAVQHGHQKGIIHRDLKPPNILVTSSGVPKIIDFGVARSTDSDLAVTTLQTDVGALIGTLQYMSPEQCAADPEDIDTRSDVYSLGVVLFELLCEDLPYDVTRVAILEAARIVQEEEPTRPSTVDKRLRGDVEIITLKALEKDRDRRYQSAMELEQDIGRYLSGDPITAKAPSAIDYLKRFARKHKVAAFSIPAIFAVLVAAVFYSMAGAARDRAELQLAEQSIYVMQSVMDSTVEIATEVDFLIQEINAREQLADAQEEHSRVLVRLIPLVQQWQLDLVAPGNMGGMLQVEVMRAIWDEYLLDLFDDLVRRGKNVELTMLELLEQYDLIIESGVLDAGVVADGLWMVTEYGSQFLNMMNAGLRDREGREHPDFTNDDGSVDWDGMSRAAIELIMVEEVWEAHRIDQMVELLSETQQIFIPLLSKFADKVVLYSREDPALPGSMMIIRLHRATGFRLANNDVQGAQEFVDEAYRIARNDIDRGSETKSSISSRVLIQALEAQTSMLRKMGRDEEADLIEKELETIDRNNVPTHELMLRIERQVAELMRSYEKHWSIEDLDGDASGAPPAPTAP